MVRLQHIIYKVNLTRFLDILGELVGRELLIQHLDS